MRYAPTSIRLIIGWDGDFFACLLPWRAYAIRPYTCSLNIGRGGDFFACSLMWRAYAIRPYTCSLNTWVGRRFLCMFAHVEGVCDTPLQFFA